MRSHSQMMMIVLAIAFAMALALTVALVCVSYIKEAPAEPTESGSALSEPLSDALPGDAETQPPETEAPVPDLGNGLRFASNGDGTCVLSGIGNCTDASVVIPEYSPVGELVTEIATMAFYNCATVTAVQIPASVTNIGKLAFADCKNLAYISVSPANPNYRDVDGVLYSADMTTLFLYPPMRAGSSATIRAVTTKIADMAFYRCVNLSRISYTGSAEQWELISIGSQNYSLTAAAKTFEG